MIPSAKEDLQYYEELKSSSYYTNNATLSQDVATLFLPRRSDITEKKSEGTEAGWYDHLYYPYPVHVAQLLATGQYDLLFTGKWFETDAPVDFPTDRQHKAYFEVGKRMRKEIESSNFKLESQEFLVDRSALHTAAMLIEERKGRVMFTHIPMGNYAIAEDSDKYVDTLIRWFKLTARQAKQKFNEDDDKLPEKVRKACESPSTENQEFTFIHVIRPNHDRDPKSEHKKDKAWSSRYLCEDQPDGHIRVGGYDEQPFVVSRYNRWGNSPWGTGPAHIGLSTARGMQYMRRALLALGDRVTNPGIFTIGSSEEPLRTFGVNIISEEEAAMGFPREMRYSENYNIPDSIFKEERQFLDELFHIQLFQLLTSSVEQRREKTAFEVMKMLAEQVGRAAPTFSRLNEEVLEPLLNRIFGIMLRRESFNDLLQDLVLVDAGQGKVDVKEPSINFTSKLAMSMKAVESDSFQQFINENMWIIEQRPEVLDNTDWDDHYRNSWKAHGLNAQELTDEADVDAYREQKQQIEAAAMALQGGEQASNIAKNLQGV